MLGRNNLAYAKRSLLGLVACVSACGNVEPPRELDRSNGGESALEPSEVRSDAPSTCDEYCDSVMSACKEQHAVYASSQVCLAVCAQFEVGDRERPQGDTFACRALHAERARDDPAQECSAAGPGGGDLCGTDCQAYCSLYPKICPEEAGAQASDEQDCLSSCGRLVDQRNFDVVRDHGGDTIECRLVHVSAASVMPALHCVHGRLAASVPWCIDGH